jgi:SMI1 / KNR4 family (SUKH-1)
VNSSLLASVLKRMQESNICSSANLVGCTPSEVAALESKYRLRLPNTYRQYLETMGHYSGRLFTSDHMAVFYPYVIDMTEEFANSKYKPSDFALPAQSLLVASRLDDYFMFISCEREDDSPLWDFVWGKWKIEQRFPSVLSWLEAWCEEAERAIANGYFKIYPNGTTP